MSEIPKSLRSLGLLALLSLVACGGPDGTGAGPTAGPTPPTMVSAQAQPGPILVAWEHDGVRAESYVIYRATHDGGAASAFSELLDVTSETRAFHDASVALGATYVYAVATRATSGVPTAYRVQDGDPVTALAPRGFTAAFDDAHVVVAAGEAAVVGLTIEPISGFTGVVDVALGDATGLSITPTEFHVGDEEAIAFDLTVEAPEDALPGQYDLRLYLSAADVEAVDLDLTVEVPTPNRPPHAAFIVEHGELDDTLGVVFDASGSTDPDGDALTFTWDLGDGNDADGQRVSHQYGAPGTYQVKLTVSDPLALSDEAVRAVTVSVTGPRAEFSVSPTTGTAPLEVSVDASASTASGAIVSFDWDFGDGNTSSHERATNTYARPGRYTLMLTITDAWAEAATAEAVVDVTASAPTAALTVTPSSGDAPLAVTFDATSSSDPVSIAGYAWHFGTADTGHLPVDTYVYTRGGTYHVTLTVENEFGLTDTASTTVTVNNPSPTARFTTTIDTTDSRTVTFEAASSSDPNGEIVAYAWAFGDGASGVGQTATHTYDRGGTYTVTLTVTDDEGATDAIAKVVEIVVVDAPRITSFQASPPVIPRGASTVLGWSVDGTSPFTQVLNPGNLAVAGLHLTVTPVVTTQYQLTATNVAGAASARTTVRVLQWPQQFAFGETSSDNVSALSIDDDGNHYVAGAGYHLTLRRTTGRVAVYDRDGLALRSWWVPISTSAMAVAVHDGVVYLAGSAPDSGGFVMAADPTGAVIWERLISGTGWVASIAIGPDGDLYTAGYNRLTQGTVDGGGSINVPRPILSRYAADGTNLWTTTLRHTYAMGSALAVAQDGTAYVVGTVRDNSGTSSNDAFVSSYDAEGNSLWWRRFGLQYSEDAATGVAVDSAGNVFVTGTTSLNFAGTPSSNAFLVSYGPTGTLRFQINTRRFAEWSTETPASIAVRGDDVIIGGRVSVPAPTTNWDGYLQAYSAATGAYLRGRSFGTPQYDALRAFALDGDGGMVVTGVTDGDYAGHQGGTGGLFIDRRTW
jgi:PKD repeat protein